MIRIVKKTCNTAFRSSIFEQSLFDRPIDKLRAFRGFSILGSFIFLTVLKTIKEDQLKIK